jgi:hypothetical protein
VERALGAENLDCWSQKIDNESVTLGILSEDPLPVWSAPGHFPSWAAVISMAVCPGIGVVIVALTTWRLRTKILVGTGGTVIWIMAFGLLLVFYRGGPTPA